MKTKIMNLYYKSEMVVKKHSPEILLGVGIAGVVTSTVLACKATMKVNDILEDAKEQIDKVNMVKDDPKYADKYNAEDAKKDLTVIYVQKGVELVKIYLPAFTIGAASIACFLASNNIMKKRNAALGAAYATIDKSYKEYRKRVAERFGEEVEKEIRYNIKAEQIETEIENEDGTKTTVVEEAKVMDPNLYSDYARFFDEASPYWQKDPEYNFVFLKAQQAYANDLLRARGRLFLNEVYEMLGIEKSKAGQVVGWVYDDKNPIGDNFVDFGIFDMSKERVRAFVNGYEPNILLDFNVDGNIWDLM
jgi:hypothetical protein